MSEIPPGLLAAADQVYASLLELMSEYQGQDLDPAHWSAEFEERLRMTIGSELYDEIWGRHQRPEER